MNRIEEMLSRALLVRDRAVPRDIVPTTASEPRPAEGPSPTANDPAAAAEDLRALCETLVTHTPACDVATFVTDQVPEPRSALVLACVLQLTDTNDGARFWWEYAAGAGQAAAAYCLYLHHLALGERDTAAWWHRQTEDVPVTADAAPPEYRSGTSTDSAWHAGNHRVTNSTTTILRVLRHLAKYTVRPRSDTVTELMTYVPAAVAVGYLRQPEMDLPMPGPDFARQITTLLESATHPAANRLPARTPKHTPEQGTAASPSAPRRPHVGETATR
ncbi:hypothetical protein [Streptomyces violascens]|uniref:Uncharacterized protein n=1 Tax=Streptomyces violascens TaxID=67381 RepID=A0ABQ3QVC5_9ACTN|nr:hypothetical protein [Streptomyces violascens]GGU44270.1 hypothetical protein GCM10010289_76200 [Streptomyces violascens]GHI41188.1 hypothetical protein Sviol_55960 [Streptomyces violascens]